eukprot:10114-Rhodomonas_salina.5
MVTGWPCGRHLHQLWASHRPAVGRPAHGYSQNFESNAIAPSSVPQKQFSNLISESRRRDAMKDLTAVTLASVCPRPSPRVPGAR